MPAAKFPSEREMVWCSFGETCHVLQGLSDTVSSPGNIVSMFPALFNARTQIVGCQGCLPWDAQESRGEIDHLNGLSGVGKIKDLNY